MVKSIFSKIRTGIKKKLAEERIRRAQERTAGKIIQKRAQAEFLREKGKQALETARIKARLQARKRRIGIRTSLRLPPEIIRRKSKTPKKIKKAARIGKIKKVKRIPIRRDKENDAIDRILRL